MPKDPIVEDVHRARARLLEDAGGDLDVLMERLAAQESENPERIAVPKKAS